VSQDVFIGSVKMKNLQEKDVAANRKQGGLLSLIPRLSSRFSDIFYLFRPRALFYLFKSQRHEENFKTIFFPNLS
jgi:hypothetical protein